MDSLVKKNFAVDANMEREAGTEKEEQAQRTAADPVGVFSDG